MAMATLLHLPRGEWETMVTFLSSFWKWYEHAHDHTHLMLKRKEADTMAYFTPSF